MQKVVLVQSGDIRLDARIKYPSQSQSTSKKFGIVLAHAYGPLGASMDDNVISDVWEAVSERIPNVALIRYNARGVGKSGGRTSWTGGAEVMDAANVIKQFAMPPPEWLGAYKLDGVILCGYSYGSMTLCAARQMCVDLNLPVAASIVVSYPLSVGWFLTLGNTQTMLRNAFKRLDSNYRTLFLTGNYDQYTSCTKLQKMVDNEVEGKPEFCMIEGVDHFWWRNADKLQDKVVEFVNSVIAEINV